MDIQTLLAGILSLLNDVVMPGILFIASLVFFWNVARYFVFEGASEEGQTKARSLALWAIMGFVVIGSLWGIVRLAVDGLGLSQANPPVPEYGCVGDRCSRGTRVESTNGTINTPPNLRAFGDQEGDEEFLNDFGEIPTADPIDLQNDSNDAEGGWGFDWGWR